MRTPFSFLKAGGAPFNPSSLPLSLWVRAPFVNDPWAGNASAGGSGGYTLIDDGASPNTGAPLNGHTPADFDGATTSQKTTAALNTFITSTSGSVVALFYTRTAPAPAGLGYQDPNLVTLNFGGGFNLGQNNTNVRAFMADLGSFGIDLNVAAPLNAWTMAHLRWDSSLIELGINNSWSQSQVVHGGGIEDGQWVGTARFGRDWLASVFYDGMVAELMMSTGKISNGDTGNLKGYFDSRYAISL